MLATSLGLGLTLAWGWSVGAGVVLGLSLSVASTVVLLKALEERNAITTVNGRIAIGWLIVEDLAMVLVLVLLPAFAGALGGQVVADAHAAGGQGLVVTLGLTLAKVAAFVAVALLVGPRVVPWVLRQVARTGSRELFTLCVLTVALGIAYGAAELFGVSFALGAFFAGMVLSESELSHKAAANALPLQDAFAVLFFVSVGMLFDPAILVREPWMVAAVLLLILVGKSLVALGIVLLMGYPLSTALFASASLAQIGEFSFILAGLGVTYGLLPQEGLSLILAGALLSITLNPLVFRLADWVMGRVRTRPRLARRFEEQRGARLAVVQGDLEAARAPGRAQSGRPQDLHPAGTGRALPALRRFDARATRGAAPALRAADGGSRGNASSAPATPPTASISSRKARSKSRSPDGRSSWERARSSARWRCSAASPARPTSRRWTTARSRCSASATSASSCASTPTSARRSPAWPRSARKPTARCVPMERPPRRRSRHEGGELDSVPRGERGRHASQPPFPRAPLLTLPHAHPARHVQPAQHRSAPCPGAAGGGHGGPGGALTRWRRKNDFEIPIRPQSQSQRVMT